MTTKTFAVVFSKTFKTGPLAGITVRDQVIGFTVRDSAERAARLMDGVEGTDLGTRDLMTIHDVRVVEGRR